VAKFAKLLADLGLLYEKISLITFAKEILATIGVT